MKTKYLTATELNQFNLDGLLQLLPLRTDDIRDSAMLGRASDNMRWCVVYRDYQTLADTPKQAIINLLVQTGIKV